MNTPRPPEHESNGDTFLSEILAVFRLAAVPGWVYVAMTGDEDPRDDEPDMYDNFYALIKDCLYVVREDTAVRWDNDRIVLSIGIGEPTYYKIIGEEFQQVLMCLAQPTTLYKYNSHGSFSVGEWVCINRPGTYCGDVGLVRSLSDVDDEERLTVLLAPRVTDQENLDLYDQSYARPPVRKRLWPHTCDDPPLSTEPDGEETWLLGRERMTKEGLLLRSFAPWELRKDMVDKSDLSLLPEQDVHFHCCLSSDQWPHMPPVRDFRRHLL
jgi:hypothetical protein